MPRPKLIGTYAPPQVQLGDRVYCRYRRAWCRVVGWTLAEIPWPRVRREDGPGGAAAGLWVDGTLAAAVRTESPAALASWFGAAKRTVGNWRKALGVKAPKREPKPDPAAARRAKLTADAARLGVPLPRVIHPGGWKPDELALLGSDHDEVIAAKIGRPVEGVRRKRSRLRVPVFEVRRGR